MAKSLRTAFIRVTSVNDTEQGQIIFNKDDISNILYEWSLSANITYWFIEHSADSEVSKTHYHIVIRFKSPTLFSIIKTKFPYGSIESAKNIRACVQYLIHFNDSSKVQYDWADIITNCEDMTPFKLQSQTQQEITIHKIIGDIDKGIIREFNQFERIPIEIWAKNKSRIENALIFYRERVCMDKHREIDVIFFSGDTGTGKTTFAKQYCERINKSYCITSSSNDPMQDYKGEDVLIMDDLRDCDYKFTDLLKILDNHTKSTIKSRYHNKAFIGDTIIITSYKPIVDWYFDIKAESKRQLYRRIKTWFKFDADNIQTYEYDDDLKKYIYSATAPNIICMKPKEQISMARKMFDSMGIKFSEDINKKIDNNIANLNEEQWEDIINNNDVPFKRVK